MRTAKEAFLQLPVAKPFSEMAETITFDQACEYALLVFVEQQLEQIDPNRACHSHHQVEGAKKVLAILRTLHRKEETQKAYKMPTLKPPQ